MITIASPNGQYGKVVGWESQPKDHICVVWDNGQREWISRKILVSYHVVITMHLPGHTLTDSMLENETESRL